MQLLRRSLPAVELSAVRLFLARRYFSAASANLPVLREGGGGERGRGRSRRFASRAPYELVPLVLQRLAGSEVVLLPARVLAAHAAHPGAGGGGGSRELVGGHVFHRLLLRRHVLGAVREPPGGAHPGGRRGPHVAHLGRELLKLAHHLRRHPHAGQHGGVHPPHLFHHLLHLLGRHVLHLCVREEGAGGAQRGRAGAADAAVHSRSCARAMFSGVIMRGSMAALPTER